jgi:hypothetical protein
MGGCHAKNKQTYFLKSCGFGMCTFQNSHTEQSETEQWSSEHI